MNAATGDSGALAAAIDRIGPLDHGAMAAATRRLDSLTKPRGSLGRLEELVVTLAGITGRPDPPFARRLIVVAAGDHGVARRGVSAYPSEVTPQMVANFVAGGAAVNAIAASVGASVTVVDVGVALPIPRVRRDRRRGGHLIRARIADGTADFTLGPAMTRADALRAVELGLDIVAGIQQRDGLEVLGIGEMGIGNTTAASALVAALTGEAVQRVTGRGTGVDDAGLFRKIGAVERALEVNRPERADPLGVLAALGGFDIALLVGLLLGGAAGRIPVVLDGFITGAAALVGAALAPAVVPRLIAAHRSPEPGHAVILEHLRLDPILDLGMRLGEGTGAALAIGLLASACKVRDEMATYESAAVSGRIGG